MKKIILTLSILTIFLSTNAKALEFRGVIIKPKFQASVKYYTSLGSKDFCTTISYKGSKKDKNQNLKCTFQITENQNNKKLKTYTVILKNNDTLKINNTKFKFLFFRSEFIFLKIEEKEKYAKLR